MGEYPAATPEFPRKGVCILQANTTAVCLADVADNNLALDGVTFDEFCNLRGHAWPWIVKGTGSTSFIETDPPTILMWPGMAATLDQTRETETDVSRYICVQAQQFTHDFSNRSNMGPVNFNLSASFLQQPGNW